VSSEQVFKKRVLHRPTRFGFPLCWTSASANHTAPCGVVSIVDLRERGPSAFGLPLKVFAEVKGDGLYVMGPAERKRIAGEKEELNGRAVLDVVHVHSAYRGLTRSENVPHAVTRTEASRASLSRKRSCSPSSAHSCRSRAPSTCHPRRRRRRSCRRSSRGST